MGREIRNLEPRGFSGVESNKVTRIFFSPEKSNK
jgi:hypothetical protein